MPPGFMKATTASPKPGTRGRLQLRVGDHVAQCRLAGGIGGARDVGSDRADDAVRERRRDGVVLGDQRRSGAHPSARRGSRCGCRATLVTTSRVARSMRQVDLGDQAAEREGAGDQLAVDGAVVRLVRVAADHHSTSSSRRLTMSTIGPEMPTQPLMARAGREPASRPRGSAPRSSRCRAASAPGSAR